MKKKLFFNPLLLAVYCLLFVAGCEKPSSDQMLEREVKPVKEKPINVQVQSVKNKSLRPFINAIGTLKPAEEVRISSEVDGILMDVSVDEGTIVSKGMPLASIDDADYRLEVERVLAILKQAEANLSNTRLEYQRKDDLYKKGLISVQQFDDISTRLSLSEAEIERAKSSLSIAKQKLSKTKIYSPMLGVIKLKNVSSGDYIRNGTLIFEIIQTDPLKLNFTITETDVGKLKMGQDVLFSVYALPEKEFNGKLNIISPFLDEKTRTLQAEAVVPNSNNLLKPGFFANVILYTGSPKDIILVPDTSLIYEGEKIKVFIVENRITKERLVKVGQKLKIQLVNKGQQPAVQEYAEIIEGIKEGEQVVVAGQQNLSDNVKVNIVEDSRVQTP
ncbi:MAG: efflux RND transporter periplasmic adaptor subunit [Nitrospinota bacterium]|jgi:RND family efflux transporter MFP subunit